MKSLTTALLLLVGLSISSCSEPNAPVGAGEQSFGALSTDARDYFYPRQAGWTYIYKNTFTEYVGTSNTVASTTVGSTDTLRTRGFVAFTPDGDSLFAMDVTYRVLGNFANKNRFNLYYFKKGQSNNGGFITGNNPAGFDRSELDSVSTVSASIDTILYAVEGPTRELIDNPHSTNTKYTRTDRIYYSASSDSVYIWYKEGTTMRKVRQLWEGDFIKNDDWRYSDWDTYTYLKVGSEDVSVSTDAGTFTCAQLQVVTDQLNTPVVEAKYFGFQTGLVRQFDEWRVTSDGANYTKKSKARELISRTYNP